MLAAHRALYGANAFTIREAVLYELQAEKIAQMRTWNDDEIERLRRRSKREARAILKRRKDHWQGRSFTALCFTAESEIDRFIERVRRRNKQ